MKRLEAREIREVDEENGRVRFIFPRIAHGQLMQDCACDDFLGASVSQLIAFVIMGGSSIP
jgi:hypothetical protein